MIRPVKPTPFRSGRLPRSAREVITFVAATAIVIDVVLLAVSLADGNSGSGQLGDLWKIGKMLALLLMMAVVAGINRSRGMGVCVVLLTFLFMEESGLAGFRLGGEVADLLDLARLETVIPAPAESWGTFLVLGVLTLVIELTLAVSGQNHSPLMKRAGLVLATLLGLLFAFTGVWALFAEAFPETHLGTVAEFGTLFVLSLMMAHTGGLLRVASLWSRS